MPYLRKVGEIVSSLKLYGFKDAVHAAKKLAESDPDHVYRIGCQFLGYEGPDMCVKKYKRYFNNPGKFINRVSTEDMEILCADRPFISQDEAMTELIEAKGTPDYRDFVYYR